MPDIQVLRWDYVGNAVAVVFSDNHIALLEPYLHYGNVEGFKRFTLKLDGTKLFEFEGRTSRYSSTSAVTHMGEGVTQEYAARYWRLVRKYFKEVYRSGDRRMHSAYITCAVEGGFYFNDVELGKASVKLDQ